MRPGRPRRSLLVVAALAVAAVVLLAVGLPVTGPSPASAGPDSRDPDTSRDGDADGGSGAGPDGEPAPDAAGADPVTFGISPAGRAGVDARPFVSYAVAPGATLFDSVAVVSQSPVPLDLIVYAADGVTIDGGALDVRRRSAPRLGLSSWMTIAGEPDVTEVTLRAPDAGAGRSQLVLPIEISVPDDAPPGDHVAGVVASLVALGENPASQNVELEQRVATRVYVRVDGALDPAVSVEVLDAAYDPGGAPWDAGSIEVTYRVTNTGNTRLGLESTVDVEGAFGLGRRSGGGPTVEELVPNGGSTSLTATVEDVWPLVRMTTTVSVDVVPAPGTGDDVDVAVTDAGSFWAADWRMLVALGLVALALALVGPVVRARRRRDIRGL